MDDNNLYYKQLTVKRHEYWSLSSLLPVLNRKKMNQLRKSTVFLLIALLLGFSLLMLQYHTVNPPVDIEALLLFNSRNRSTKNILYWTSMFGKKDFNLGLGSKIFEGCPHHNCFATSNRQLLPVEEFDAILFHGVEYSERIFGKPKRRSPDQVYIISNQESPDNTPARSDFRNFFNWTMTYRQDSDIVRPYGYVEKKKTGYRVPSIKDIERKRKKIAWFVSNCYTSSERHRVYTRLKQFIPVDVYGLCGTLVCSHNTGEECYEMLERDYKFYLSFENSICDGYVTEKLYNILKRDVVPIVYSGADMSKVAPPKSVINVMDFDSIDSLVRYIKYLDSNSEKYVKYFEWKKDYVINTSNNRTLCTLCQKLNEKRQSKVYRNMSEWWFGRNSSTCTQNKFLRTFL